MCSGEDLVLPEQITSLLATVRTLGKQFSQGDERAQGGKNAKIQKGA